MEDGEQSQSQHQHPTIKKQIHVTRLRILAAIKILQSICTYNTNNQVNPSYFTVAHSYAYTLHRFKMRTRIREVYKSFLPRTLYEQLLSFWRQSHKSLRVIPSASLGEKLECESKERKLESEQQLYVRVKLLTYPSNFNTLYIQYTFQSSQLIGRITS